MCWVCIKYKSEVALSLSRNSPAWSKDWLSLIRGGHNAHPTGSQHRNYVPVLHRSWDIARYWSKIVNCNLPHLYLALRLGPWAIVQRCLRFSKLVVLVQYRRVTDGRTHDDSICRASIASCGKNLSVAVLTDEPLLHYTHKLWVLHAGLYSWPI